MNTLRNTKPIKFTLTNRKSSGYGRTPGQATILYKAGLDPSLDIPDSEVSVVTYQARNSLSMSTSTKVARPLSGCEVQYGSVHKRKSGYHFEGLQAGLARCTACVAGDGKMADFRG